MLIYDSSMFMQILLTILFISFFLAVNIDVLDHSLRKKIYDLINANSGIHFREILRTLSIQPGNLAYHLYVLRKEGLIRSVKVGNYCCFYTEVEKNNFQIVLTKLQKSIVTLIRDHPGITLSELSKMLEKNKMVVSYNTTILEDVGIIKHERRGMNVIYYLSAMEK